MLSGTRALSRPLCIPASVRMRISFAAALDVATVAVVAVCWSYKKEIYIYIYIYIYIHTYIYIYILAWPERRFGCVRVRVR